MLHQAIGRRDYDHIVNLVCDKEDLLELMPEIPKLVQRLFQNEESFLRVSPHFAGCPDLSAFWTPLTGRPIAHWDGDAYCVPSQPNAGGTVPLVANANAPFTPWCTYPVTCSAPPAGIVLWTI
jgi:hypothetical protein